MPLLPFSQQQAIKKISANNEAKYEQLADEVEEIELKRLLGIALLQNVQKNPLISENVKLLDGTDFVDRNGNTISHKGLRWVLAYMNYSKYLGESFVNDTFTGMVHKKRPDSELISEGATKRLQLVNRQLALIEWEIIKEYLDLNSSEFPLWNCTKSRKPYTPRFTGVRKTSKIIEVDRVTRTII